MKPASSAKRAKRAKAAAKSAAQRFSRPSKAAGKAKAAPQKRGATARKSGEAELAGLSEEGLILHARPTMGRQEQQAACVLIKSGALSPGVEVEAFEEEFCRHLGLPEGHALAVSSGAAALYLALHVLDGAGKTVALPAYGGHRLRAACALAGAREYPVDLVQDGIHMDLDAATASGAEIAIISHTFGLPQNFNRSSQLQKLKVIEDCSESLGAKIGNQSVGTVGDLGVYSFAAEGIITSGGQGGMIVSRHKENINKARRFRQFNGSYDGQQFFDFTMTDLQAAIGRVQLAKLSNLLARREEIFAEYKAAEFDLIDNEDKEVTPVRYQAVLRSQTPLPVLYYLARGMIETIVPIGPDLLLGAGQNFDAAKKLSTTTLSIPIYPHLSNAEVAEIIEQVDIALEWCASQPKDSQ